MREDNRVVAGWAYIWCLSKGIKSLSREQLSDWDMIALIEDAKAAIPKEVAEAWIDLNRKGSLPYWAVEQIDAAVMERAAI